MLEIKRNNSKPGIVFEAVQNGEILAEASARLSLDALYIDAFSGDKYLFDGMCRALMNFADNRGALKCVLSEDFGAELTSLLGAGRVIDSIETFLKTDKCRCCGEK